LHPLQPDLTNISEHAAPYLTAETGKINKTQEYIGGQPLFGTFDAPEVLSVQKFPFIEATPLTSPNFIFREELKLTSKDHVQSQRFDSINHIHSAQRIA